MIVFDGITEPAFRRPAPLNWRSISATLAPSVAAISAAVRPAAPAPIITRWYGSAGFGFSHVAGCTSARRSRSSACCGGAVSYTHLRAHETRHDLVCRLLLEKKKQQ